MTRKTSYRLGLAVTIGTMLFLVLGAGALGIIGAGGRPDLMYVGLFTVAAWLFGRAADQAVLSRAR